MLVKLTDTGYEKFKDLHTLVCSLFEKIELNEVFEIILLDWSVINDKVCKRFKICK